MLVGGDGHSDYTQLYGGSPFPWHGLDRPLWRSRRKLKTRHKIEQKALRGRTCGHTCPGPRKAPRLRRCLVLSSSSRPAWPPSTHHRGGVLLSPTSGLGSPASANLYPPPLPVKPHLPSSLSQRSRNCSPHSGPSKTLLQGPRSLPVGVEPPQSFFAWSLDPRQDTQLSRPPF